MNPFAISLVSVSCFGEVVLSWHGLEVILFSTKLMEIHDANFVFACHNYNWPGAGAGDQSSF